ncbi:MAG: glycosyltransferase family 2 protein [Candidatus Omnitrophica bacterium]|nr:glycosyltransferase family 2 protein [Candidatus Omnitrophota bacterium]
MGDDPKEAILKELVVRRKRGLYSVEKVPLTVVVSAKNEEANIAACLQSVSGWADEMIVVDDESTDKTAEISLACGAKVLKRKMDIEGIHRNWGYAQARNEWVLSLDADESVSPELREEITSALLNNNGQYHAFSMPIKTYIGSYWVKHSGWYPASKLRMFMKSRFKYEEVEVHPRAFLTGVEGHLTKDIVHKGYPDFEHFLASLNRQTTLEARKWINTNRRIGLGKVVWRTLDRFPRIYFGKKGYKDGFIGFMVAFFASLYQIMSYAKYWQMKKEKGQ